MRSFAAAAIVALSLSAGLVTGCMSGDGMQEKLRDATRAYNGSVRWGDADRAVAWLPVESQQGYLERFEKLEDQLVIVDYQMTRLDLDRTNGIAASRAEIMWHTEDELVVKTTRVDQLWQFHEGQFVLVDERRAGGDTLALFAEAGEDPHPFLPGLEAYRETYEIGKDNDKRAKRRGKAKKKPQAPGPGTGAASFRP
jgi:hypothetical protein